MAKKIPIEDFVKFVKQRIDKKDGYIMGGIAPISLFPSHQRGLRK